MEKVRDFEDKIVVFLKKHCLVLLAILATVLALFARYKLLRYESTDYVGFLEPWFAELKAGGGLKALANYPGDYNAPYMTILAILTYLPIRALYTIKLVSIGFEIVLALAVGWLIYTLKPSKKLAIIGYVVTLFLPQILANGALWGQCDAIYASFAILALGFLLREKWKLAFVMLGVACAFKLQFIFILPIFIVKYVLDRGQKIAKTQKARGFSVGYFLIIPAVDLLLCLPAIIAGKSIWECLTVYLQQTQTYNYAMSMNFVSFWNIFEMAPEFWYNVGVVITLVVCAGMLVFLVEKKAQLTKERTIEITLWFMIVMTFLLPGMHERYLIIGEILAVVYCLVYRKGWIVALMVNAYAWITYGNYLTGNTALIGTVVTAANGGVSYQLLALVELVVIAWWTQKIIAELPKSTTLQEAVQ